MISVVNDELFINSSLIHYSTEKNHNGTHKLSEEKGMILKPAVLVLN